MFESVADNSGLWMMFENYCFMYRSETNEVVICKSWHPHGLAMEHLELLTEIQQSSPMYKQLPQKLD